MFYYDTMQAIHLVTRATIIIISNYCLIIANYMIHIVK